MRTIGINQEHYILWYINTVIVFLGIIHFPVSYLKLISTL
jgi:hypothetical protein